MTNAGRDFFFLPKTQKATDRLRANRNRTTTRCTADGTTRIRRPVTPWPSDTTRRRDGTRPPARTFPWAKCCWPNARTRRSCSASTVIRTAPTVASSDYRYYPVDTVIPTVECEFESIWKKTIDEINLFKNDSDKIILINNPFPPQSSLIMKKRCHDVNKPVQIVLSNFLKRRQHPKMVKKQHNEQKNNVYSIRI